MLPLPAAFFVFLVLLPSRKSCGFLPDSLEVKDGSEHHSLTHYRSR